MKTEHTKTWQRARDRALRFGYGQLNAQLLADEVERRVNAGEWMGRALADVIRPKHESAHGYRRPTGPGVA